MWLVRGALCDENLLKRGPSKSILLKIFDHLDVETKRLWKTSKKILLRTGSIVLRFFFAMIIFGFYICERNKKMKKIEKFGKLENQRFEVSVYRK